MPSVDAAADMCPPACRSACLIISVSKICRGLFERLIDTHLHPRRGFRCLFAASLYWPCKGADSRSGVMSEEDSLSAVNRLTSFASCLMFPGHE